jgi:hypothetical protein
MPTVTPAAPRYSARARSGRFSTSLHSTSLHPMHFTPPFSPLRLSPPALASLRHQGSQPCPQTLELGLCDPQERTKAALSRCSICVSQVQVYMYAGHCMRAAGRPGRAVDVRARGPDGLATYWLGSPSRSTYRLAPQRSLSHVDL